MPNTIIRHGNNTHAKIDAIVNVASPQMMGGNGVDRAIYRATGSVLRDVCENIPAINNIHYLTGKTGITTAGNLDSRYVIHTVGLIYNTDPYPEESLARIPWSNLDLAIENTCNPVVFPAISYGVYGFPLKRDGSHCN